MGDEVITHEYAGFLYEIKGDWPNFSAVPLAGQHPAAAKEKHRRAAADDFKEENNL